MADDSVIQVSGIPEITSLQNAGDVAALSAQISEQWLLVQVFPNEIPGLKDFKAAFDGIAQFLVQLLEILNQILEAAKIFVAAYANPIQTLATVLIEQIKQFINDIKQIGLYLTGDWNLFKWPLNDLRGGYQAYEKRMVARLQDQTDPTRPVVSPQTYVFGLFLYASVDITGVYKLIKVIGQLMALFSFSSSSPGLPASGTPRIRYGFGQNNLVASFTVAFTNATDPLTIANLEWTIDRPSAISPVLTFPLPPPQGFVIEVSTVGGGLVLMSSRPDQKRSGPKNPYSNTSREPREEVIVGDTDGNPVIIYGGGDVLKAPPSTSVSTAFLTGGGVKPGATFFYLSKVGDKANNEVIPPDKLTETTGGTTKYYLQRTFKLSQAELFLDPNVGVYRYALKLEDLPNDANFLVNGKDIKVTDLGQPAVYYVRVSAISDAADQSTPDSPDFALKYDLSTAPAPIGPVTIGLINGAKPSDQRGRASAAVTMTFPTKTTKDFYTALKSALALLVLLRADLRVITNVSQIDTLKAHDTPPSPDLAQSVLPFSDGKGTDLESFESTLFAQLVKDNKTQYFIGEDQDPSAWASSLLGQINLIADEVYKQMGSLPAIEELVVDQTLDLRTKTLEEICEGKFQSYLLKATILSSLSSESATGEDLSGFRCGVSSSPFQAFKRYGKGGLEPNFNDNPYLYYKTPNYKIVEAFNVPLERVIKDLSDNIPLGEDPVGAGAGAKAPASGTAIVGGSTSKEAAVKSYMAKLGWTLTSRKAAGVGTSTTPEFLKLVKMDPTKILFQSEGYPVVYDELVDSVTYIPYRSLFNTPTGRSVMQQAQLVLNVAAAAYTRAPSDTGAWLALRFGNTFMAGALDRFLTAFNQYIKAINNAFASTVQTIIQYIDFLQARIRELQRFIRLINYYIQQIDLIVIPRVGALLVTAAGTEGVLAAFISAKNKPADGAVNYGAGLALVIPLLAGTKFIVDLITDQAQSQAQSGA